MYWPWQGNQDDCFIIIWGMWSCQFDSLQHLQWASYQIHKIAGCTCAGIAGNVFPDFKRKLLVSNPGMHHITFATHVPWCVSGSLTCGGGENVPGNPGECETCDFTYLVRGPWQYDCCLGDLFVCMSFTGAIMLWCRGSVASNLILLYKRVLYSCMHACVCDIYFACMFTHLLPFNHNWLKTNLWCS